MHETADADTRTYIFRFILEVSVPARRETYGMLAEAFQSGTGSWSTLFTSALAQVLQGLETQFSSPVEVFAVRSITAEEV